jgi:hypothetical protein
MKNELSPVAVERRLAALRISYEPETIEGARVRLARPRDESFDEAATRRLAELRALCELTEHLHAGHRTG